MSSVHRHLVVGLAGTGKSTFIAALRHVTEAGDIPGALRLATLGSDDSYANELRSKWMQCEELDRTKPDSEVMLELCLAIESGEHFADLEFPDLSGESIEQQWSLRLCDPQYASLAQACSGVLLFIHPHRLVSPTRIADANLAIAALLPTDEASADSAEPAEPQSTSGTPAPKHDPRETQAQIKMVELLQFIHELRRSDQPVPLAVMLSAWDIAERSTNAGRPITPTAWMQQQAPLLFQFLSSNASRFRWRVFGVSAQGGDLKQDRAALLEKAPSDRLRLVSDGHEESDVTVPIRWLHDVVGTASA